MSNPPDSDNTGQQDRISNSAACVVTVKRRGTGWRPEGTCGWTGSYWSETPEGRDRAVREGARHLYEVHGIYAGGHYGVPADLEADERLRADLAAIKEAEQEASRRGR